MSVHISCDSTCDLSRELCDQYNIGVTPLYIQMGADSYLDGAECVSRDVFDYTGRTGKLCSTSAVTIGDYLDYFGRVLEDYDEIVHLTISSDMSACCQNAVEAAREFPGRVRVVDSRSLSAGIGLLALDAAALAREGADAGAIEARILELRDKLDVSFVLDTLEYLHKGGRCSGLAALGANLLKLRPCIEVTDGRMQVGKKYRGSMSKCLESYVSERVGGNPAADLRRVVIADSGVDPALVAQLDGYLRSRGFREILTVPAGAAIACHCGPGTFGLMLYDL